MKLYIILIYHIFFLQSAWANGFFPNYPPPVQRSNFYLEQNMPGTRQRGFYEEELSVINDKSLRKVMLREISNNTIINSLNNINCEDEDIDLIIIQGNVLLTEPSDLEKGSVKIKCDYIHFLPNSSLATFTKLDIQIDKRTSGNVVLTSITNSNFIDSFSLSKRWNNLNPRNSLVKKNGYSAKSIKFSTAHASPLMTLRINAAGESGMNGGDGGNGGLISLKLPEYFNATRLLVINNGGAGSSVFRMPGSNNSNKSGSSGMKGKIEINKEEERSTQIVNPKDLMN